MFEVKFTVVPAQMEVVSAVMEIDGVLDVIVNTVLFDVTAFVVTQVSDVVITTHTESLFAQLEFE